MTTKARKVRVLFWLCALAFPFVLIALVDAALGRGPGIAPEFQVRTAQAVESSAATPAELPVQGWRAVKLPGYIADSDIRPSSGWFWLTVHVREPGSENWALYFAQPYSNLAVFVNGVFIAESGPMTRPVPMFRYPLMFTFPSSLLRPGENVVHVRSLEPDYLSRLDRAAIGPVSRIAPEYRFTHALTAGYKWVSVVVLYVLAALFAALWWLRRRETGYGWFALGLLAWAAQIHIILTPRSPVMPEMLWTYFASIFIGVFAMASYLFVNRHLQWRQPRLERFVLLAGLAGATYMVVDVTLLGLRTPRFVPYVWMPFLLLIAICSLSQLVRACWRRPDFDVRILLAATWLLLVVGARDLLIDAGLLPWKPMYMSYTVGFALCGIAAVLLHRFAQAFDAAERARDELDLRVREKSAELQQNLVRMKDLERERALSAERERILQDMHDGLGGHLVQALAIATSRDSLRPLEEPLRSCLDELRLMVDSLEPANGDLASVLGSLRPRISRRLALAGVDIKWHVDDLPTDPELGPRRVLDVARVLQEAITNAIKHSGCDAIAVRAGLNTATGGVEISVTDNGRGLQPAGSGHGLVSMRRRSAALGGELIIEDASPGTRVTLRLPANRNAAGGQSPEQAQTEPRVLRQS